MKISHFFLISWAAILGFTPLSAQNIKRAYKQLEKNDLEKASESFMELLSENDKNTASHFGMSIILSDDSYSGKDYLEAWLHADFVLNNFSKISADELEIISEYYTNTEERRSSRPPRKKMELSIEAMEDKLIRLVREGNELEIVNRVIKEFPEFKYHQNAIHIRNYLEFRASEKTNTILAYDQFIENFPDAAQVPLAIKKRNKLIFENAKEENNIAALEIFIKKYPDAESITQAVRLRNNLAFNQAKQKNTVEAIERFIKTYPDALEIMDANILQKKLIYERAKRIKTLESFNDFIKKYPEGGQYVDIFNLKSNELGKRFLLNNKYPGTNFTWAKIFDNNSLADECGPVAVVKDNIIIGANTQESDTSNFTNGWVLFLNADGVMQWNKQIGEFKSDRIKRVTLNSEHEIIFGGYTGSNPDTLDGKAWLFKINEQGNKIWNRIIGPVETTGLSVNKSDEIIVGGYQYATEDSTQNPHYFLTRLSENAKRLWRRDYINKGKLVNLAVQNSNEIVAGGGQWLFKTDKEGYLVWEAYRDSIDSIATICANATDIFAAGKNDSLGIFISKYTPDGKQEWLKIFSFETRHDITTSVVDNLGNVYVGGNAGDDAVIIAMNREGKLIDTIMFGTSNNIHLNSMAITEENDLLIGGTEYLNDEANIFILKYTPK